MAIKDMRLTNHDSILLILTGYRYALGRADSLLVFDTNRHQVARSMPVHDATFGSGTDGLLLLASGNGQNNEITGFANNDLTQNILTLSCAGIPKLPAASIGKHRSEEHTSELQSLMRISYAVFCLKKKNNRTAKKSKKTTK